MKTELTILSTVKIKLLHSVNRKLVSSADWAHRRNNNQNWHEKEERERKSVPEHFIHPFCIIEQHFDDNQVAEFGRNLQKSMEIERVRTCTVT